MIVKSVVSKATYFIRFFPYDVIIKLMTSLKSIFFSKTHDGKYYLNKGYLRKGK